MYKRTITYEDYNGNERTEDFYFHFSKAELAEMEMSVEGGMQARIEEIIQSQSQPELAKIFKKLLLESYGRKADNGRRFEKSPELSKQFSETEAYSILYMELASDDVAASEFINGVIPSDLQEALKEATKEGGNSALASAV